MPLIKASEAQRLTRKAFERSLEPFYELFNEAISRAADEKQWVCEVLVGNIIDSHQVDCVYEQLEYNGFKVKSLFHDIPGKLTLQVSW